MGYDGALLKYRPAYRIPEGNGVQPQPSPDKGDVDLTADVVTTSGDLEIDGFLEPQDGWPSEATIANVQGRYDLTTDAVIETSGDKWIYVTLPYEDVEGEGDTSGWRNLKLFPCRRRGLGRQDLLHRHRQQDNDGEGKVVIPLCRGYIARLTFRLRPAGWRSDWAFLLFLPSAWSQNEGKQNVRSQLGLPRQFHCR